MPLTSAKTPIPQHYLLILYPGHQLLDSAGPLDILSTVTKQHAHPDTNITLTIAAETRSPVPLPPIPPPNSAWTFEPHPDLPNNPTTNLPPGSFFNVPITPHITFAQALTSLSETKGQLTVANPATGASELRPIDVVLIPGGIGSRLNRISSGSSSTTGGEKSLNVQSCIEFISALAENSWINSAILTVCTGSDLLARTGLLDGRRATTNHLAFEAVRQRHPTVEFLGKRRWVRSLPAEVVGGGEKAAWKGEIWTSAGISAGMDLMLWFVAEVYGAEFARGIARRLEYEWREGVKEGEVDPYY